MKIKDLAKDGGFSDGDWVESKDQDVNGEIRLIQLADIGDGYFIDKSNRYLNKETAQRLKCTYLKKGDILIARMPDPIGRCCLFPFDENEKYVTVVDICIIRIKEPHHLNYIKYGINSPLIRRQIEEQVTGTTRLRITKKKIGELDIPLPPLATQKKIAAILDAADAHRQKTKQLLAKYDELAQSIFLDMFGDPVTNPKGWEVKKLEKVCTKITDGTHDTPERLREGVKFITGKHIRPYKIDYNNSDYVEKSIHKEIFRRCNPELGDVLYTNIGVNLGTAALNIVDYEFSMKNVALLKPETNIINGRFLEYFLNSQSMKAKIVWMASLGGAQQFLSLTQLRKLKVLVPNYDKQELFKERIKVIEYQKKSLNKSGIQSENLFNSLLQKAFKGELGE